MSPLSYKDLHPSYSFDEVALIPGDTTINPDQVDISFTIGNHTFPLPIIAAAMDAVVDPDFAIAFNKLGGLAVLNLEGIHSRYADASKKLKTIVNSNQKETTYLLQEIYSQPIKENLIGDCIQAIKKEGAICAVSVTPANTKWLAPIAAEAGMDILVVQSTVTTARHLSKSPRGLHFGELVKIVDVPILVGNCASYTAAMELMNTGIAGLLIGVGPGAACTTREVLGVGVPQVTATMDCAAARDDYQRETGRYVAVITDGGIRRGSDLCKAFAAGADAAMLGAILAQASEAPGQGYHWGMANPHPTLPRGTRIQVGTRATLEQILLGPTSVTDGTQNLAGALRTAMGVCAASNIQEMHQVGMVVAPSIGTEGKFWQLTYGQ
ncbi:MAG: GuaB3 family IMP dehydrogenase-related protein [Chloroflexota bacterium]|nr:GuaB3 family IMP dehydrogenase-related protein [Chloroflexota bacterium]